MTNLNSVWEGGGNVCAAVVTLSTRVASDGVDIIEWLQRGKQRANFARS